MPVYSIVIPCYNVEDYLPAFLSMVPTNRDDFELIFVDDSSTDKTLEIVTSFAKKNKWFFVYQHKKNLGLSSALNTGVKHMKTQWFARLDPDDFVYPLYFETVPLYLKPSVKIVRYKYQHNKNNKTRSPWWMHFYFKKAFGWSCVFNVYMFGYPKYKPGCLVEDLEMFVRQYKRGPRRTEVFVNKFLVAYRRNRPGSIVNSVSPQRIKDLEHALKSYWQNKEIRFFTRVTQSFWIWIDIKKQKRALQKTQKKTS